VALAKGNGTKCDTVRFNGMAESTNRFANLNEVVGTATNGDQFQSVEE